MSFIDPEPVDCVEVLEAMLRRYQDEAHREGARECIAALEYAVDLLKREDAVQEVIAAVGDTSDGFQLRLIRALKRLAEWCRLNDLATGGRGEMPW